MQGKTIRIFLVDGSPTGVLTAEIINWTGHVLVAPRSGLADLSKRDEVRRTGVYCLVGPDPTSEVGQDRVYFGEGDNVWSRWIFHDQQESKGFWTRTVVVTSKDENLTKSHGRYLESRLITMARQAQRAALANETAPEPPPMPESDVADMEFFLEQMKLILPVVGFGFLQPRVTQDDPRSLRFVMNPVGTHATAIEAKGEFVVLKGSTARKQGVESWDSYRALHDQLVKQGKLADGDDAANYVFTEDVAFSSPSAAAAVVYAGNQNGRIAWKVEGQNKTYAEWQEEKLKDTHGNETT